MRKARHSTPRADAGRRSGSSLGEGAGAHSDHREKIARLRNLIKSGSYQIRAEELADAIMASGR